MPTNRKRISMSASHKISRREFLKSAGLVLGSTFLVGCGSTGTSGISIKPTPTSIYSDPKRNLMAAKILGAAAILMKDVKLREGLSPYLYAARSLYQSAPANFKAGVFLPSDSGGNSEGQVSERLINALTGFSALTKKLGPSSTFLSRIISLLSDPSLPLPLGDFSTLDPILISKQLEGEFQIPTWNPEVNEPLQGTHLGSREYTGPTELSFIPRKMTCVKANETSGDEIILYSCVTYVENISDLVNQIESYLPIIDSGGEIGNMELSLKWNTKCSIQKLFPPEIEAPNAVIINSQAVATIPVYHGFCPYAANFVAFEDDNYEYDALNETIGEIAGTINAEYFGDVFTWAVEQTILSMVVPGYSVVASTEALLVAGVLPAATLTAIAVVDIANFFDDDDRIGSTELDNNGDLIDIPEGTTFPHPNLRMASNAGEYLLDLDIQSNGIESFSRYWRVDEEIDHIEKSHSATLIGDSGDDDLIFYFHDRRPDVVIPDPIRFDKQAENAGKENVPRHAEWINKPKRIDQVDNHWETKGIVHWGLRGSNDITYYAEVRGWKFQKQRD
jgi:hypothetical protein